MGVARTRIASLVVALLVAVVAAVGPSAVALAAPPAPLGGAEWWFDAWRVFDMWNQSKGADITVAVVESGVNASIPELAGSVLPGVDLESKGNTGQHDYADNGHGTAMATLIAANGSGTGTTGVAPEVKILPVIIAHNEADFNRSTVAPGIRWAVDHGANVVNLSIGGLDTGGNVVDGCPVEIQDAVKYAVERNVVVVAAAGNEGDTVNELSVPAVCKGVLAVGAVDRNAQPWVHSQRQSYVDVAAPGVDIRSANHHGKLSQGSGTSDATALTSAAVALVWSKHRDLTNREVVARLLYTLRDKPPAGTKDLQRGYGTLVPARALTDNIPRDAPNPVFDELTPAAPSPSLTSDGAAEQGGSAAGGGDGGGSGIPVPVFVIGGVGIAAVLVFLGLLGRRRRPRAITAPLYSQTPLFYPPQSPPGAAPQSYYRQQGSPPGPQPPLGE